MFHVLSKLRFHVKVFFLPITQITRIFFSPQLEIVSSGGHTSNSVKAHYHRGTHKYLATLAQPAIVLKPERLEGGKWRRTSDFFIKCA